MKAWQILTIILYIIGLICLVYYNQQDPIISMNIKTANVVNQLIQTKYFRIIRLNINQECPLGIKNRICKSKSCSVCRCNHEDIPQFWTNTDQVKPQAASNKWSKERDTNKQWVWHVEDESNDEGQYFDLYKNIESFTNYDGNSIWNLIYKQNCFSSQYEDMCEEQKILYRIISGLHTSISTHLSKFYKNISGHSMWADIREENNKFHFNISEYNRRVLSHPERIENLLFIYRILAKAVKQASSFLLNDFTILSDNATDNQKSKQLIEKMHEQLKDYDFSPKQKQSLLFFTPQNSKVKQYQKYIHNISNILNCVQCEKCRLFGKMQTYGVGTALKILLGKPFPLKRNQIVALFNVFNKISMSVQIYNQSTNKKPNTWTQIYSYVGCFLVFSIVSMNRKQQEIAGQEKKQKQQ